MISKSEITLRTSLRNKKSCEEKYLLKKKWLIIILKGFIKHSVIGQNPTLLFFFLSFIGLLYECFPLLIKVSVDFEKLIRFRRQAFIVDKNVENLKILKEMFGQKLVAFIKF